MRVQPQAPLFAALALSRFGTTRSAASRGGTRCSVGPRVCFQRKSCRTANLEPRRLGPATFLFPEALVVLSAPAEESHRSDTTHLGRTLNRDPRSLQGTAMRGCA